LALRDRFRLEYAEVDTFIEPARRNVNTEIVLEHWSELTTASQLRCLYHAHARFQLEPTNTEIRDTAERVYSKMARSRKFTHVYILAGIQDHPLPWCIAFCAREEPVITLPSGTPCLDIADFPPKLVEV
jgi:hypothetical protein